MFRSFWEATYVWLYSAISRPEARSVALARRAARRMAATSRQHRPGLWVVPAPPQYGYDVTVQFLGRDRWVVCLVGADLVIERDWVPRELALRLLEENSRCAYGSFRLMEVEHGLAMVHAQLCDSRLFSAAKLADIGQTLLEQYQRMLEQLYACDLIVPGPLSRETSSPARRS
ncbi:MAG: hypothetical protein Q8K78_00765 [Planctomycetaceae bacterium]|nr:hypothetical protein [Planctomycetaceae bacterium]